MNNTRLLTLTTGLLASLLTPALHAQWFDFTYSYGGTQGPDYIVDVFDLSPYSSQDRPTLQIVGPNASYTLSGLVATQAAEFSVRSDHPGWPILQSGVFNLIYSKNGSGNPITLRFDGSPAPVIESIEHSTTGSSTRYVIRGRNFQVIGQRTTVGRVGSCDVTNSAFEFTGTRIEIVLPACNTAHRIYVSTLVPESRGRVLTEGFNLSSRSFSVTSGGTTNPTAPQLTRLDPDAATAGRDVPLTALGSGFTAASRLVWRRNNVTTVLQTTFRSSTSLSTTIPAALMVNAPAVVDIFVQNTTGCDGTCPPSNALPFTIRSAASFRLGRPIPDRAAVRPANGPSITVDLEGEGFAGNTEVYWQPDPRITSYEKLDALYLSSSSLRAQIPARLLTTPAISAILVRNPATGAQSNAVQFTVFEGLSLTDLFPRSVPVGSPSTVITASGQGFTANTRLRFSDDQGVSFIPESQTVSLTAGTIAVTLAESRLAVPKNWDVVAVDGEAVTVPPLTLRVVSNLSITSISPTSRPVNSGEFDLTVNGTGFDSTAVILFGSNTINPHIRSDRQLTARVTLQGPAGEVPVRVRVGSVPTEQSRTFTFTAPQAPSITSLNPPGRPANSGAFNLVISGQNLGPNPAVTFAGQAVSVLGSPTSTSVTVAIPASLIQQPGDKSVAVTVSNVASPAFNFDVSSPAAPLITLLSPNSREAGGGAFAMTITGQNLGPNPSVFFGSRELGIVGTPASTSIQVQVPGDLLMPAREVEVRVRVGSQDATALFTILPPQIPGLTISAAALDVPTNGNTSATVTLASSAPVEVAGVIELGFEPNASGTQSGYADPALLFVGNGSKRLDFRIPAGRSLADIPGGGAFNVGTVAGTIAVRVTELTAAGARIVGLPQPRTVTIPRSGPVIVSAELADDGASGIKIVVIGYAPIRDITQATVTFAVASNVTLSGSASFSVPVQQRFTDWFAGPAGLGAGSRFRLEIPFSIAEGSRNSITGFTVTLAGSEGVPASGNGARR